jgi:y4mF family transcriptional regulator
MQENLTDLSKHIKLKRKQNKLTQPELALKAGVGLRFVRDLEQGKTTLRIDKVNDVLRLFGETLGPIPLEREKLLQQNE